MRQQFEDEFNWQEASGAIIVLTCGAVAIGLVCLAQFDHATIQKVMLTTLAGVFIVCGTLIGLMLTQATLEKSQFAKEESTEQAVDSKTSRLPAATSSAPPAESLEEEVDPFVEILRRKKRQQNAA